MCIARLEVSNPTPNRKALYTNCDASNQKEFQQIITDDVGGEDGQGSLPGVILPLN